MKRSGFLKRRTPLRSRTRLARRTPLRGSSTLHRNRTILQRSAIAKATRASGRARPNEPLATWCEAGIAAVCTGRAVHRHHVRRRAQGGGDEAANTRDVCSACHGHIHANPGWAYEAGLLARGTA